MNQTALPHTPVSVKNISRYYENNVDVDVWIFGIVKSEGTSIVREQNGNNT
jgi:hypothetical protein